MYSVCHYNSPLGGITLACDEEGLTGLWLTGRSILAVEYLKVEPRKNRE